MPATPDSLKTALRVVVWRDGETVSSQQFTRPEVALGRSPASDVVLDAAGVGWNHARLLLGSSVIRFLDESSCGSFRNGQRVTDVRLGRGGVIDVPPFEIDLSVALVADDVGMPASSADVPTAMSPKAPPPSAIRTPVPSAPVAELRIVEAPGGIAGTTVPLAGRPITIGRGLDCDIRFDLASVSRRHAKLTPTATDRWLLQDTGSRNGVEVNGQLVQEIEVESGDRITFGIEVVAILQTLRSEPTSSELASGTADLSTAGDSLRVTIAPSAIDARVTAVRVVGRVDSESYPLLRDELAKSVGSGSRYLLVDLADCNACDHAGLGVVLNAQMSLGQKRGALRLVGVSVQLADTIRQLKLDRILVIVPNAGAGVADLVRLIN